MIGKYEPADIIRRNFATRLESEIAKRGWNQSDLAREASKHLPNGNLSRDNVSNYIRQRALPSPAFLLAIAKALGTTSEDLLPERVAPPVRDAGVLPSVDVRDMGANMAFLRVNRQIPWKYALEILEIVAKAKAEEADADNG